MRTIFQFKYAFKKRKILFLQLFIGKTILHKYNINKIALQVGNQINISKLIAL